MEISHPSTNAPPSPSPPRPDHQPAPEIKPDDSPVKGPKRGKGKKDKKKHTIDPFEKKKPKLDELKVEETTAEQQFSYLCLLDKTESSWPENTDDSKPNICFNKRVFS